MGSNQSTTLGFNKASWDKVSSCANYDIVKNKSTLAEAQQYTFLPKTDRTLQEETNIYQNRFQNSSANVQVVGAGLEESGFGFCSSRTVANVLTERIPTLLSDVGKLNQHDENTILYNAIKGFDQAKKYGLPHVTEKLIGFNSSGAVKVWINENFGMNNTSDSEPSTIDIKPQTERGVISELVETLKPHLSTVNQRLNFFQTTSNFSNFEEAIHYVAANSGSSSADLELNKTSLAEGYKATEVSKTLKLNSKFAPDMNTLLPPPEQVTYFQPSTVEVRRSVNPRISFKQVY